MDINITGNIERKIYNERGELKRVEDFKNSLTNDAKRIIRNCLMAQNTPTLPVNYISNYSLNEKENSYKINDTNDINNMTSTVFTKDTFNKNGKFYGCHSFVNSNYAFCKNPLANNYTISIWIKPTDITTIGSVFSIGDFHNDIKSNIIIYQNKKTYTICSNNDKKNFGKVKTNQWVNIIVKVTSNKKIVILDNEEVVNFKSNNSHLNNENFYLGSGSYGSFCGFVDELTFYDRILDNDEVETIYNGGKGLRFIKFGDDNSPTTQEMIDLKSPLIKQTNVAIDNICIVESDSGLNPQFVLDNNNSTLWNSTNSIFPHWINFKLPKQKAICKVKIQLNTIDSVYSLKDFKLQGSNVEGAAGDNNNFWEDIYVGSIENKTDFHEFVINSTKEYKYIRMLCISNQGNITNSACGMIFVRNIEFYENVLQYATTLNKKNIELESDIVLLKSQNSDVNDTIVFNYNFTNNTGKA